MGRVAPREHESVWACLYLDCAPLDTLDVRIGKRYMSGPSGPRSRPTIMESASPLTWTAEAGPSPMTPSPQRDVSEHSIPRLSTCGCFGSGIGRCITSGADPGGELSDRGRGELRVRSRHTSLPTRPGGTPGSLGRSGNPRRPPGLGSSSSSPITSHTASFTSSRRTGPSCSRWDSMNNRDNGAAAWVPPPLRPV